MGVGSGDRVSILLGRHSLMELLHVILSFIAKTNKKLKNFWGIRNGFVQFNNK